MDYDSDSESAFLGGRQVVFILNHAGSHGKDHNFLRFSTTLVSKVSTSLSLVARLFFPLSMSFLMILSK